jgi:hypothetical protein
VERAEEDLVETFRYVADRLVARLAGLTDDEWAWAPIASDDRVTIRWRLDHIASTLTFVLHVLDEVVHHGAEASLLRDLDAAR